jgi:hypothetical protein
MFYGISSVPKLDSDLMEQNKEWALVCKKLLELDPDTVDSNQEEEEVVPAVGADVVMEEPVEMSEDAAREALCEALTFHIGACVNLIFG